MKEAATNVVLNWVGVDFWSHPVYQVEDKELYVKDLNMGNGAPDLHWCSPKDDPDGEPDYPFSLHDGVTLTINKPKERVLTREDKKFILAKMIAANQFVEGKRSVEWVDFASSIHDIELTKELLAELSREPMEVVWTVENGYVRVPA